MLKFLRDAILQAARFLPNGLQRALYSRLRAYGEMRKMQASPVVVVSFSKSGRTWVRALLSHAFRGAFSLKIDRLLGNRNYHKLDRRVPAVLFTHDNFPRRVYGDARMEELYNARKVVLLVRDPRDVEVSAFFHASYRMDPVKKRIYQVELSGKEEDVYGHLKQKLGRGSDALSFLNRWASMMGQDNVLLVRYEDLKADAGRELRRICDFIGVPASDRCLRAAVEQASFDSMKKKEREGAYGDGKSRFGSRGWQIDNAYKVRRGKVGGYGDYMIPAQAQEIDAIVDRELVRGFGYRSDEAAVAM